MERGSYYGGDRTAFSIGSGKLAFTPSLTIEASLSINWVDLPFGGFTTHFYRSRVFYSFSPRLFLAGFLQYNSRNDAVSTNVRVRWEYDLGSELFVVFIEERPTDLARRRFSDTLNCSLVVKINRLLRF